jgi:hypothetical protein
MPGYFQSRLTALECPSKLFANGCRGRSNHLPFLEEGLPDSSWNWRLIAAISDGNQATRRPINFSTKNQSSVCRVGRISATTTPSALLISIYPLLGSLLRVRRVLALFFQTQVCASCVTLSRSRRYASSPECGTICKRSIMLAAPTSGLSTILSVKVRYTSLCEVSTCRRYTGSVGAGWV